MTEKMRPTGLYFMTPVWGESYTRLFVDIVIPSHLAPGNLPGLSQMECCRYFIYTTAKDSETIKSSSAFRALSTVIPVQIELIEGEIKAPHDTMSECFRRGIRIADDHEAASVFLTPDLVFSDGSFTTLQRLAMDGWRVVYIAGIRLLKPAVLRVLRKSFLSGDVLTISPRSLMKIALRNLHPLAHSSFWDEGEDDLIPANLYWRAGLEGILARCFHLHPVLVYPKRKHAAFFGTVDDDYVLASCPNPALDYVSRDSDEMLAVELSDLEHFFRTGMSKGSTNDVAFWAEMAANSRHRALIDVPIYLHTGSTAEDCWRVAEDQAGLVVSQVKRLLRQSGFRLLFSNHRALERRLVRQLQETRLELSNNDVSALAEIRYRYGEVKLQGLRFSFKLQARQLLMKLSLILIFTNLHGKRVLPIWLLRFVLFIVSLYSRTARKCYQALVFVRETMYGMPWSPNPLNITWIYIQRLGRDVRATLRELNNDVVVCSDPAHSIVARISFNSGVTRFAIQGNDGSLDNCDPVFCDLLSGLPLADGSVSAILVDAMLRKYDDLNHILGEAYRVLKPDGRMAVKFDRVANPSNGVGGEVFLSMTAIRDALRPRFEIVTCRRQGRIGTILVTSLSTFRKLQVPKLRTITAFFWGLFLMPVEMILGPILNFLGIFLNRLDTTERNYVSCIVVARKVTKRTDSVHGIYEGCD